MDKQLQTVEYSNQRILTTQQLAEFYEVDPAILINNFNRNKERYIEGKHYFFLEGEELQNWFCSYQFDMSKDEISKIRRLYLWTKRGTFRHAKSLNTDKAWAVYETLEESYFNPKTYSIAESIEQLDGIIAKHKEVISGYRKIRRLEMKRLGLLPSKQITSSHESVDEQALIIQYVERLRNPTARDLGRYLTRYSVAVPRQKLHDLAEQGAIKQWFTGRTYRFKVR